MRARSILAVALLAAGCGRERIARAHKATVGAQHSAPAASSGAVDSTPQQVAPIDSLQRRGELRMILHRVASDSPDADGGWHAAGWYDGDTLVLLRGNVPDDSLPLVSFYLREGRPVAVEMEGAGGDQTDPRSWEPKRIAGRYQLDADTIVAASGTATRGALARVLGSFLALRGVVEGPGQTVDAFKDTLTARPRAPWVAHGVCPFECCHYGDWRVESALALRDEPSRTASVAGRLAPGADVVGDSGMVRVDTVGIVVVTGRVTDDGSGLDFAPGDSLLLLDYQGEGFYRAWLRGHSFGVSQFWDSTGTSGGRLVRAPSARWWAHLTTLQGADTVHGWLDMSDDSVRVSGTDSCGD